MDWVKVKKHLIYEDRDQSFISRHCCRANLSKERDTNKPFMRPAIQKPREVAEKE